MQQLLAFIMVLGCCYCVSLPADKANAGGPPPPRIQRFVDGIDAAAKPMDPADVARELNDPWAVLLLRQNVFPANLDDALAALDKHNAAAGGLPQQFSYFVSESGQIPVDDNSIKTLKRQFRMVVTRGKPDDLPPVLLSAPAGDREGFVELMSWDPDKSAFNFYRRPEKTTWIWKGDSGHAFRGHSRERGCFACHLNGTPIMKELDLPWSNWHSQSAGLPGDRIPSDAIRNSPLFKNRSLAQDLERPVIRGWVPKVNAARLERVLAGGTTVREARSLLRPLFETTMINLASSPDESNRNSQTVRLPPTFFLNVDALTGPLELSIPSKFSPAVSRAIYAKILAKHQSELTEGNFHRKPDTHFAFLVPEPSLEDTDLLEQLIDRRIITRRFATCVLMIDFTTPVFSPARQHLLRYVPEEGTLKGGQSDLPERTAKDIAKAAQSLPADSPERQFLAHWKKPEEKLRAEFQQQIKSYLTDVRESLRTQKGFDGYLRLAVSRRNLARDPALNDSPLARSPLLNESSLLFPTTTVPAQPVLKMNSNGTVSPR